MWLVMGISTFEAFLNKNYKSLECCKDSAVRLSTPSLGLALMVILILSIRQGTMWMQNLSYGTHRTIKITMLSLNYIHYSYPLRYSTTILLT